MKIFKSSLHISYNLNVFYKFFKQYWCSIRYFFYQDDNEPEEGEEEDEKKDAAPPETVATEKTEAEKEVWITYAFYYVLIFEIFFCLF